VANTFNIGDVVELKSGGPAMTVEETVQLHLGTKGEFVKCQWFGGKKLEYGTFPVPSVKRAEKAK
jgi:uncharacterized protein YodC (DUF2158 family)